MPSDALRLGPTHEVCQSLRPICRLQEPLCSVARMAKVSTHALAAATLARAAGVVMVYVKSLGGATGRALGARRALQRKNPLDCRPVLVGSPTRATANAVETSSLARPGEECQWPPVSTVKTPAAVGVGFVTGPARGALVATTAEVPGVVLRPTSHANDRGMISGNGGFLGLCCGAYIANTRVARVGGELGTRVGAPVVVAPPFGRVGLSAGPARGGRPTPGCSRMPHLSYGLRQRAPGTGCCNRTDSSHGSSVVPRNGNSKTSRKTKWPGRAREFQELWNGSTDGRSGRAARVAFRKAYEGRG